MKADSLIRYLIRWSKLINIFALINIELINMIWDRSLTESLIFSIEGSHWVARKFTSRPKVLAAVDLCRRHRLANRRIGRGIGEDVEELWCETHTVRRRCLSKPMTNLLSPFEGVDGGSSEGGSKGWKQSFQTLDSVSRPAGTLPCENQLLYSSSKHCYAKHSNHTRDVSLRVALFAHPYT